LGGRTKAASLCRDEAGRLRKKTRGLGVGLPRLLSPRVSQAMLAPGAVEFKLEIPIFHTVLQRGS
jgi:hypothetical protein